MMNQKIVWYQSMKKVQQADRKVAS